MGEYDTSHISGQSEDDDVVLPFYAEIAGVNGRVVRLGTVIDGLLSQHDYPEPVSILLGEAIALTFIMGTALKFDGKLILQAQTDGVVSLMVVQFTTPGSIRGYAKFDKEKFDAQANGVELSSGELIGKGTLAITVDQGADMERYQGIVALEGGSLSEAAQQYFDQSEQLPSFVRLAVARHYVAGEGEQSGQWYWRAGGLMIQDLTREGGREAGEDSSDPEEKKQVDEDGWNRAKHLAGTVEDHELLDPMLTPERLVYRLFHEERVRVYDRKYLKNECTCSRDHIQSVIAQFGEDEIEDMVEDGRIAVTCEFCSTQYFFQRDEF